MGSTSTIDEESSSNAIYGAIGAKAKEKKQQKGLTKVHEVKPVRRQNKAGQYCTISDKDDEKDKQKVETMSS